MVANDECTHRRCRGRCRWRCPLMRRPNSEKTSMSTSSEALWSRKSLKKSRIAPESSLSSFGLRRNFICMMVRNRHAACKRLAFRGRQDVPAQPSRKLLAIGLLSYSTSDVYIAGGFLQLIGAFDDIKTRLRQVIHYDTGADSRDCTSP